METRLRIVVSEILLFSSIGFVIYLLAITVSFAGCCFGITSGMFDQILLALGFSGLVVFGVCSYLTCFKKSH